MSTHLQIRNLSKTTHRQLKVRAAQEGVSMSDYVKRLIKRELEKPSWDDIEARIRALAPVALPETTAEMIRRERDSR